MKIINLISRILVGLVFVFSGFIKSVDPWGFAYKFGEYFEALGLNFLVPYALPIAILLIVAEFVVGFCLVFGFKMKIVSWIALLFMLIFLPLTLWLAITNKVNDCGCFGDAIKLTNWQTFYKNVILIIPVIWITVIRNKFRPRLSCLGQWIGTGIGLLIVLFIIWYSYAHLPIIDFLPYKKGSDLAAGLAIPKDAPKDEFEQFITLRDTTLGKELEVTVTAYTNDSNYWCTGSKYKYVSISEARLVKKGYTPPLHDFTATDSHGHNYMDSILQINNYVFLFIVKKCESANISTIQRINNLARYAAERNWMFVALTSSLKAQTDSFIVSTKAPYPFFSCDETTLKTIIRANPGLLLLKKGVVIDKWHYNDFPTVEEFKSKYE